MRKPTLYYLVDIILFTLMSVIIFIGILLGFIIPSGPTEQAGAKFFWELHRHQWGDIHLYVSLAFILFLIVHIVLHWSWVRGSTKKIFKSNWVYFPVLLLPGLVVLLFLVFMPNNTAKYSKYGHRDGTKFTQSQQLLEKEPCESHNHLDKRSSANTNKLLINGRSTLFGIEEQTGISARKIAEQLQLPHSAPLDEQLGILKRRYSFSIHDVREIITSLKK